MSDIRDRLGRIEKLVADKLMCRSCSGVSIIVIGPGEDAAAKTPGPCETCGRDRRVIVVTSPLPGAVGSSRKATARDGIDLVGSTEIDEPDRGHTTVPPAPAVN